MQKNTSDRIREILTQHGVAQRQHIKTLANILGLHYVSVQQKITGVKSWTDEQIAKITEHFGESVEIMTPSYEDREWNAILLMGTVPQRCLIQIDPVATYPEAENMVAVEEQGTWIVQAANVLAQDDLAHRVLSIKFLPAPRIAVLDDDARVPRGIAAGLATKGIQVQQFTAPNALIEAARSEMFEAYILDWMLGRKQTAEHVIDTIRATVSSTAPIYVLTGELSTEVVTESDLARMVARYDVSILEKPALLTILAATLYKKFFFPGMQKSL